VKERPTGRCNADAFFVSISRRAREAQSFAFATHCFHECRPSGRAALRSGFAPTTSRPFGSRTVAGPSFDLAVDHIPMGSYRRSPKTTSLVPSDPGELGHPPRGALLLEVPESLCARAPGTRGCGPAATPVLSTDVCCSRILFSKTIASVSAHAASSSHTMREPAVSRRDARFGEPSDRAQGVVFPKRRSAGVPLMLRRSRAPPVELCPPASARDRSRDLRSKTRKPRPALPSRVNGFLGFARARSTFSLRSLLRICSSARIGDPIRPLPRPRSFQNRGPFRDAISRETNESFCRVTDPTRHNACPQSPRRSSALLSKRGTSGGVNGSVPGTALDRWPRPAKATAVFALLRILADPLSRDSHGLPRRARCRHPRHRRMTSGDGSSPASPPPIQILRPCG
jgi:hypothetical protein